VKSPPCSYTWPHYGHESGTTLDFCTVPVTVDFKTIIPIKTGQFYAAAGIGAYFVQGEIDVNGLDTEDVRDIIVGGKFLAGSAYNITDTLFIGMEGKYISTEQANLGVHEFSLNGYTATGVFGIRY